MCPRLASLRESKPLRSIVGTVVVLAVFVGLSGMALREIAPVFVVFASTMVHEIADDIYDLPAGTNWLIYGTGLAAAGGCLAFLSSASLGAVMVLAGLWFVLDGAMTVRYGPARTRHEYVTDLEDDAGETMLRIQTMHVVSQALRDASGPRTVAALATEVDLTESRVESTLEYLAHKGRVERVGDRYRAIPPRWGRLTPVVRFLGWLPRRVGRPFRRLAASAS
ncbi:hypothetical protein HTZ84_14250 [Haloterrigena sp. SYSU A558-1]|uniref:HTH iclR-type domain-containing protein n=1 Tax=Haloterrigena gelatinilytica TaxID=2741724 RepID=A0ABX2LHX9_9EURY|nr:hypothetical protein [Haloterrigena gelatinilytica]NUC73461.1 hypothetical protein [Haloterrigena gelatinilytica]